MTSCLMTRCPCGSDAMYETCCGVYHQGVAAPTPEALMRSRYSAFALDLFDYLNATWHSSTRPQTLAPDPATQWKRLSIERASAPEGEQGTVHFKAFFWEGGWHVLEEVSRFVFEAGRWYYVDGDPRLEKLKLGRNERCPCGSGRKLKACCGG
ncbi:YchJ family protein [Halomonas sp. PAMB 3264]|uniref:YchJ family protein n=1 Tax=Halomonas sp. PAMB 3264 TaxID=3075222 RepID=UPI00289DBDEA|nr:YchJ family protein [Halomonas sp. PAMB 3264]WNL42051.1 YchJ family protein [Halomonas sp. PAMB 3264]